MKLFLLLLMVFPLLSFPCDKKTDPKKVMLFLNTNDSTLELKAAEAEACELGLTFVRLPEISDETMTRMEKLRKQMDDLSWEKKRSCKSSSASCEKHIEKIQAKAREISKLRAETPTFFKEDLDKKIAELSEKNVAIATAIFSGHDGGGYVEGSTGRISKTNFFTSMNKYYGKKPKLKGQLQSVFLWGCYTATPEEILAWKASFPELKILAGFNGIAPSNERKESPNILTDLLSKESKLIQQKKDTDVLALIRSIEDLKLVHSGIYVNACNEEYYYSKDYTGDHFETFEQMKKCDSRNLQNMLANFNGYFSGEKPHNETEIRKIYDYARKFDHCFNDGHPLDGNHVALLVFFNAVKFNFGNVFKGLTSSAEKEFKDLRKGLPHELLSAYESASKSFFFPSTENLEKADRKSILHNIAVLEPLIRHPLISTNPQLRSRMKHLLQLQSKMEDYLHLLKPSCMYFLDWHYHQPNFKPTPKC